MITRNTQQIPVSHDKINEHYARVLGKAWLGGKSEHRPIGIEEIPIMYMADGTIVCIPKLPEMGCICEVGLTGMGKSLSTGRIVDEIFWNWQDYVAIMNDSQEESYCWSEPNENVNFQMELKKINQKPMPLPVVYLFPNFMQFEPESLKDKNSITISIPFEEVINNIEKYIPDLGNSEKYLMAKKEELLKVQNAEELLDIIKSIDDGSSKGLIASAHKIESSFRALINEGILNFSNLSVPAYLTIIENKKEIYSGNPFTAIMMAESVPSFITGELYQQKFKDAIFSYYINSIFEESRVGVMKGKRVWLFFDELTKVVHANQEDNSQETETALTNVASRGRNQSVSLVYATQRYNEIPKSIRSQTKYAIIFRHKVKEEVKLITDDFGLDRSIQDKILKLKRYEVYVATTEYFVCYKGDRRWEDTGPLKGRIFPPLHENRFLHKKRENK